MAHTKEEDWRADREKVRANISEYYKAKSIMRKIQQELGIKNLHKLEPWSYKTSSLRAVAQLLRRSTSAIGGDRTMLGLERKDDAGYISSPIERDILNNINLRQVSYVNRKILSVEETILIMSDLVNKAVGARIIMPKYYNELVLQKGIGFSLGSASVRTAVAELPRNYSGIMQTLNARELKASWLWNDNLRAFKVAAVPYSDNATPNYAPVLGYVVRSSITGDVQPAFNTDLSKAVSLCKRRVKQAVMKQMGL